MVTKDGVGQDPRLRPRQAPEGAARRELEPSHRAGHAGRHRPRHGRLHVAGAGERQGRSTSVPTSSRSGRSSTRWRRAGGRSSAARPRKRSRRSSAKTRSRSRRPTPASRRPSAGSSSGASQKDPDERYASTRDLARDVRRRARASLGGVVRGVGRDLGRRGARAQAPIRASPPSRRRSRFSRPSRAGMVLQKRLGKSLPPSYQQITFGSGTIRAGRFAPDGQTIVYSAAWDGNPLKLYLKHPSSPDSLPLELPSANLLSDLALRRDGDRHRLPLEPSGRLRGDAGAAALTGGSPRDVAEGIQEADWAAGRDEPAGRARRRRKVAHRVPDGQGPLRDLGPRQLRAAVAEGRPHRLPRPPLSARRRGHGRGHRPRRKEDDADGPSGRASTGSPGPPSGDEVWFTATEAGANRSLYAVTLDGQAPGRDARARAA